MRRLFKRVIYYGLLDLLIDTVLSIGFAPTRIKQRFNPAFFNSRLVTVKRIP